LGIEAVFKGGLRVTDAETMEVVEMVLGGRVNKGLVTLIELAGGRAVGLCGKDATLLAARQMVEKVKTQKSGGGSARACAHLKREFATVPLSCLPPLSLSLSPRPPLSPPLSLTCPCLQDIGFVGDITSVDPALLSTLVEAGYIPVLASVAADPTGQALNVNADTAAGEVAAALKAEKLVLMTDVPGVLMDKDDVSTKVPELSIAECRELVGAGTIGGGMIPKVECCVRALAQGVRAAHIVDGRQKHSLLMELLTDEGVGTMITG
jgi:acetylglutamate kinase